MTTILVRTDPDRPLFIGEWESEILPADALEFTAKWIREFGSEKEPPEGRILRPTARRYTVRHEGPHYRLKDLVQMLASCSLIDLYATGSHRWEPGCTEGNGCPIKTAVRLHHFEGQLAHRTAGRLGFVSSSSVWIGCHDGGLCIAPTWINTVSEDALSAIVAAHLARRVGGQVEIVNHRNDRG